MSSWQEVLLREDVSISHGFAFKGEFFTDQPTGRVLVTPGNFAIGGGFQADRPKYYGGPVDPRYVLNPGDLVVTMTDLSKKADTLGYPALIPNSSNTVYLHNQRIGRVVMTDSSRLDRRFLYYLLCSAHYRHHVVATASGSTVKHTSPNRILDFAYRQPPPTEQRAIAHILGTLDDKIELNRKMNATLDEVARTLFASWFVDFGPVRAKAEGRQPAGMDAATAALFPDRFVDSELGPIPEGWRSGTLGEVVDNQRQVIAPNRMTRELGFIGLEHLPRGSISLQEWGVADKIESGKFKFCRGDILFGKLRPYFHKVGIAPVAGVCSTDILVLKPKCSTWFGYSLGHISSDALIQFADAGSEGTRMPRTSWKRLSTYPVVLPPEEVATVYDQILRPFFSSILANIHHSRTLQEVRDLLLPELLSGKIRVPRDEQVVEAL